MRTWMGCWGQVPYLGMQSLFWRVSRTVSICMMRESRAMWMCPGHREPPLFSKSRAPRHVSGSASVENASAEPARGMPDGAGADGRVDDESKRWCRGWMRLFAAQVAEPSFGSRDWKGSCSSAPGLEAEVPCERKLAHWPRNGGVNLRLPSARPVSIRHLPISSARFDI